MPPHVFQIPQLPHLIYPQDVLYHSYREGFHGCAPLRRCGCIEGHQQVWNQSMHVITQGERTLLISPNDQVLKWYQARTYDVVPVHPVTVYPVLYLASYLIFPRRKRKNSKAWPQSAQLLSSRRPRRRASTSLHRPRYVYQIHISTKSLRIWRQVTLSILEKAKELSVPTLWLQPGAEDETVIEYIKANDLSDRVIYGGPCILVIGDDIAKSNIDSAL